jgi:1,2-phenylacetyl-CoA epoxidase catalytic subunit
VIESQVSGPKSQAFSWLLGHADDNMVLAQRLGDWISRGPELEEDGRWIG